jgi:hypothetical protein
MDDQIEPNIKLRLRGDVKWEEKGLRLIYVKD